jgi:hypothetical protein
MTGLALLLVEKKQKLMKICSHLIYCIFIQGTTCELFNKIKISLIAQVIVVLPAL